MTIPERLTHSCLVAYGLAYWLSYCVTCPAPLSPPYLACAAVLGAASAIPGTAVLAVLVWTPFRNRARRKAPARVPALPSAA